MIYTFIVFCMSKFKEYESSITAICVKEVAIELWFSMLEWNGNTIDTFLSKKIICIFIECVGRALNFKEVYFVNTSSSVYEIQ